MGSVIGKAGLTCRRKPVGWWGRAGEGGRPQVAFQKHQPAQLLPGVVWQSFWECLGQEEQAGLLHSAGELREGGSIPPKDGVISHRRFFGCILERELSARQAVIVLRTAVPTQLGSACREKTGRGEGKKSVFFLLRCSLLEKNHTLKR